MSKKKASTKTEEILTPNEERKKQQEKDAARRLAHLKKKKDAPKSRIKVTGEDEEKETTTATAESNDNVAVTLAPLSVAKDPKKAKKWETATQEERTVATMLCAFNEQKTARDILNYFNFGKEWEKHFPKKDEKSYERGTGAVANGASMSGISASSVYQILATLKVYDEDSYAKLAEKARANGVVIKWTHLRVLGWRLGKTQYAAIRKQVESVITNKYHTEDELNKLIDELAPDTIVKDVKDEREITLNDKVMSICKVLQKISDGKDSWIQLLERWDEELDPEKQSETQTTLSVLNTLIAHIDNVEEFTSQVREYLNEFRTTVDYLVNQSEQSGDNKKSEEETAEKIKNRIDQERMKKKEAVSKKSRLALKGEFVDYTQEEAPKLALRPGDKYPDEEDDEERELADDEEWEYETIEVEYDEDEEEDLDDSVFDESGDIV